MQSDGSATAGVISCRSALTCPTAPPGLQPGGSSNKCAANRDSVGAGEACEGAVPGISRRLVRSLAAAISPRRTSGPSFASESPGPLRSPSQARPARYEERRFATISGRSEQPRLRNGPQDRRLDQNRRSRCAAHRWLYAAMPEHDYHRDLPQTVESSTSPR